MLWIRRLVCGLSQRKYGLEPRLVCVILVVDKVTLGQVFLRVLRFSPVSITLHIHLCWLLLPEGEIVKA
jgi:branched-subunit amino acid transport protein